MADSAALAVRNGNGQPEAGSLVPSSMEQAMRLAEVMCKGKLVPQHLQGSPADCLLVIEQASRWGLSPFAVAQSTSVIQGKLMYEGKLVAAVINARGDLADKLRYEYSGTGDKRTIRVVGRLRGEDEPRDVTVELKDARTNNRVWQTQPDQQLMYHGVRVWARRHTPELMLGVWSPDEFDASPQPTAVVVSTTGATRDGRFAVEEDEVTPVDDGSLEKVPIYNVETGEQTGWEAKASDAQIAELNRLQGVLRNNLAPATMRKRLIKTFSKESVDLLSTREAAKVIESLLKAEAKQQARLETAGEGTQPTAPESERVPGSDDDK